MILPASGERRNVHTEETAKRMLMIMAFSP